MRTPLFAAAAAMLALTAGVAHATPQETFIQGAQINGTFGAFGFQGNASNGIATFNATGGYTLRKIGLSATITEGPSATATFGKEAGILVTPPGGGQQFVMMPFLDAGFTGSTSSDPAYFAIPLTAADPAGLWTLQFIEMFDDGGATAVDVTWSNVQIVFDDEAPALPGPAAGAVASQTFTDVPSDGTTTTSTETRTLSYGGTGTITGFEISGIAEVVNGRTTSVSASPMSEIRVGITPPGGTEIVVQPYLDPTYSPSVGSIRASFANPITGPGDFTLRFFEATESNPGIDSMWDSITLSLLNPPPPASVVLNPEASPGNFVQAAQSVDAPGEIKWFSFTLTTGVDTGAGGALDIDTEGSGVADTAIGLYGPAGTRIVTDFDDGTDLLSQITLGGGFRNPPGNGLPYNGRDGASLPPGTYYVAVSADNTAVFQPGLWGVTTPSPAATGVVNLRVRYYPSNAAFEGPAVAATLNPESTPGSFVTASVALNTGSVTWVAINVPSGAVSAAGQALDIDVEGTVITPANDTNFGLYRNTGALVDSDTADGTGSHPQLTYGTGLRFPPGDGLFYNGRDGAADITPGTYYLAINGGGGAFNANFGATNTGANSGTVIVRARWYSTAPFETPPVAATLNPENTPGQFVTADVSVAAGVVTWVRINVPSGVAGPSGQALDIDTEGSTLAAANNPNIGLYNFSGTLANSDADDGSDLQAQLTYGAGRRNPVGNGQAYNGRDAANLAGGSYYLAINGGAGAFGATWAATNTGANTGTVRVRARYFPADAPIEAPTSTDLGTISISNQPQVVIGPLAAGELRWFKFVVPVEASDATTFWVDIDTNVVSTFLDTEIGLYRENGDRVADDDDDGEAATPTTVAGFSALSFGAAFPVREYGTAGWVDGNGRDLVLAPGTYYLAVGRFTITFNNTLFNVVATGVATTVDFNVNIRTNIIAGPTACNAADIATAGNPDPNAGPDGFLTGDDFDLFINAFFNELRRTSNNTLIADLVDGDGNPPPDGFLTGSDFDYFLGKFFEGC